VFGRSKSDSSATVTEEATVPSPGQGKGRPTPTRKEAEAAARARRKPPRNRKEAAAADRARRSEATSRARAGIRNGEERYLPQRDKGPERRFIRDFVDARFSFIDLMMPLLLVMVLLGWSGNPTMQAWSSTVLLFTLMFLVVDIVTIRFRLRRELKARFPDSTHKGATFYAATRAMNMKFMRMPKPQVKIGQRLPEHYR